MTVVRPNSISGITSITAQTDTINFFKSDGSLAGLLLNGTNFNTTSGVSTFNALNVGVTTISVNSSSDALRITQLGSGNALVVEDETNPDTSPFVVTGIGSVGVGITNPAYDVDIVRTGSSTGLRIRSTSGGANLALDSVSSVGTYSPQVSFQVNGSGKWAIGGANIGAASSTAFSLYNYTGATGNVFTVDTNNNFMIGDVNATGTASQRLQVTGGAYVSGNVGIGTTNPTTKLEVQGDVRVVGVITATSDVKIGTKSVATTGKAIAMAMVFS